MFTSKKKMMDYLDMVETIHAIPGFAEYQFERWEGQKAHCFAEIKKAVIAWMKRNSSDNSFSQSVAEENMDSLFNQLEQAYNLDLSLIPRVKFTSKYFCIDQPVMCERDLALIQEKVWDFLLSPVNQMKCYKYKRKLWRW